MRKTVYIFSILIILSSISFASTDVLFFYETGCPECARIFDFFKNRIKPYYEVNLILYEIHKPDNASLFMDLAEKFKAEEIIKKGTPAVFVGDSAVHGSNRAVQRKIEEAIRVSIRESHASPLERLDEMQLRESEKSPLTLPAVIGAAAVDAVNPCACAVLVLLLGTVLLASRRQRKKVLGAGFAFTAACYLSYLLMGLGLFVAIRTTGIQQVIYTIVAFLAVLIGLWNIKDAVINKGRFRLHVPNSWQPVVKKLTSQITSIPGAFFIGILISLFLLPCTSGPYIVIIGLLSQTATRASAVFYLLLYNLIFILPFLAITLGVGLGLTTTARVETWRQAHRVKFHLSAGLVMLGLGITMIILLLTGKI